MKSLDLALKEKALKQVKAPAGACIRFRASDRLLAFLDSL